MTVDRKLLEGAYRQAVDRLMALRGPAGHWRGRLSSSALSTATAVTALALIDGPGHGRLVRGGLDWLAGHVNADGGWGDTVKSRSNLSTTLLVWSAFAAGARPGDRAAAGAEEWLSGQIGGLTGERIVRAVLDAYGDDRTFAVPILTLCALTGRLGQTPDAWRHVPALPFELAALPHRWLRLLRVQVVSYALPALVSMGLARHCQLPPRNPLTRLARRLARPRALKVLGAIQPSSGGFLEAAPLTSFVAMSLASAGAGEAVVDRCVDFLTASARPDGSWPIDTDLATWVTTLSVNALAAGGRTERLGDQAGAVRDWLLGQQFLAEHPYTRAAPGGWGWTDLPGGVPDADDTAGAMLALRHLPGDDDRASAAARAGAEWLVGLQNADGGIPTFCRGWGSLPFDSSSPDLTAHALAAWQAWREELTGPGGVRCDRAIDRALDYMARSQTPEGAWVPLWLGNEHAPGQKNPTYGTARAILGVMKLQSPDGRQWDVLARAAGWLAGSGGADGGWGGAPGVTPSVEETALAVDALAALATDRRFAGLAGEPGRRAALEGGIRWLIDRVRAGDELPAAPIGLYFARLWYFEKLYPLIFTVSALGRALALQ